MCHESARHMSYAAVSQKGTATSPTILPGFTLYSHAGRAAQDAAECDMAVITVR